MDKAAWNHSIEYHRAVLAAAPARHQRALDVGCGTGILTRRLAAVYDEVVALDTVAGLLSSDAPNIHFLHGDVLTYPLEPGSFDCVAAVAVLHHVPLSAGLQRLGSLVRPGGVLVIVGLYRHAGLVDWLYAAAGLLVSHVLRLSRGMCDVGAPTCPPQTRLSEVRRAAAQLLPGVSVRRRLLFRYVLHWQRPLE